MKTKTYKIPFFGTIVQIIILAIAGFVIGVITIFKSI